MNLKQNCAVVRMLSITAELEPRNSPYIICTFEAKAGIGPSTPQKKESPTTSTKARSKV